LISKILVKYLWSPDPDTKIPNTTYDTLITIPNIALTITSSYCDEAASLTYNIEELPCGLPECFYAR
jgi:hypothetical protein